MDAPNIILLIAFAIIMAGAIWFIATDIPY